MRELTKLGLRDNEHLFNLLTALLLLLVPIFSSSINRIRDELRQRISQSTILNSSEIFHCRSCRSEPLDCLNLQSEVSVMFLNSSDECNLRLVGSFGRLEFLPEVFRVNLGIAAQFEDDESDGCFREDEHGE